ncbi:hypothetical protein [Polyangium mundeleinium]|uniref:Knr4/Smi1-like domain-containing protein n=1 Tax=Polyangium mundeleinium TaxID=2995306 RepID=A0ABT5F569_9BACT|nr:hypothetical protein [Polyangium mundeleinium]MDC0749239.1 hypothetical protein [Polyangium mundeleinium]
MLTAHQIEEIALRFFPFEHDGDTFGFKSFFYEDQSPSDDIRIEGDTLTLTYTIVKRMPDGSISDVYEFEDRYDLTKLTEERWTAYLEGFRRAFPSLEHDPGMRRPEALDDPANVTADDFERAFLTPDPEDEDRRPFLEKTEEGYQAYLLKARPKGKEDARRRRAEAVDKFMARHAEVAARVEQTYGLLLPKHAALTWAFFSSLSPYEWRAPAQRLGIGPYTVSSGVLSLYSERAFQRPLKEGFDPQMHFVAPAFPPEALIMFCGDFSAFALFYDDPAYLPSGAVVYDMEDKSRWMGETFLDFFRDWARELIKYPGILRGEDGEIDETTFFNVRLFLEALEEFEAYTEQVREEDRARMRWPYNERAQMAEHGSGVGICTDQGDGAGFEIPSDIHAPESQAAVAQAVARARQLLAEGDPRYALALGRELHCACTIPPDRRNVSPLWQAEALSLMVAAYEALGRGALARKAEVHHANRGIFMQDAYKNADPVTEPLGFESAVSLAGDYFPFLRRDYSLGFETTDGQRAEPIDCIQLQDGILTMNLAFTCTDPTDGSAVGFFVAAQYDVTNVSVQRFRAFLAGWQKAFPDLVARWETCIERIREENADQDPLEGMDMADIWSAYALANEANTSEEDFAWAIRDGLQSGGRNKEEQYRAYLEAVHPSDPEQDKRRWAAALETALVRFPAVAARVEKTYGFRLPKHVALTWAYFNGLQESEARGFRELFSVEPAGVMELFEDGGLDRKVKEGFDERLHQVQPCDLPEYLLVAAAGSDHRLVLVYDDPSCTPSGVMLVDSYFMVWRGETLLDQIRDWVDGVLKDEVGAFHGRKVEMLLARRLLEVLDGFAEHEERIRREDRAAMRWSYEERSAVDFKLGIVGIRTDQGDSQGMELADARTKYQDAEDEVQAKLPGWIARAKRELADGDPRYALALGRELHASYPWPPQEERPPRWQAEALSLMVAGYEALGRHALARRVEAHHAERSRSYESAYEDEPSSKRAP